MQVYIGSDHGGLEQKNLLAEQLKEAGYAITDCGSYKNEADDYPDFALAVSKAVGESTANRGILLCRSGEGMEMAANKVRGIRAALVWRPDVARETRADNDANVLVLPSDFVSNHDALEIAKTFLSTDFSQEERHIRRLEKVANIERMRNET
jgi:ribose 5-phosphate isomerase B